MYKKDIMELKKIINRNLCRYDQTLRHFVSTGRGDSEGAVNRIASDVWEDLVARYNSDYGAKGRKPDEAVLAEAERRGFATERIPEEETIILRKENVQFSYQKRNGGRYLFCTSFSCIPPIRTTGNLAMARISYCRVSLEAGPLFDCMEELLSVVPAIKNAVNERLLDIRRAGMIAEISLPSLSEMTESFLSPKGIKYYIGKDDSGDFIQVNIIKDIWFGGPVSLENIERILHLIPYGIKRPDCIKKDIDSSFRVASDWTGRHEAAWKRYREELKLYQSQFAEQS